MKIYLASAYAERDRLNEYRAALESEGFTVTSRWLNGSHEITSTTEDFADGLNARFALEDWEDVAEADILIHFNPMGNGKGRGGRHVELGAAVAMGKLVFHVGPAENVFHFLPGVNLAPDFSTLLTLMLRPYRAGREGVPE